MKTFTIDNENNITLHATVGDAKAVANAERFGNETGLAKLAARWPAARLTEIWNSLPGVAPIRKFKDRATAVSRIWSAIQNPGEQPYTDVLETAEPEVLAPVAPQAPAVAPQAAPANTRVRRPAKPPTPATKQEARAGRKTAAVLAMMNRPGGTTLQAIMQATGWQAHSVRGFVSGTLGKKMGLTVISTTSAEGDRNYSIES